MPRETEIPEKVFGRPIHEYADSLILHLLWLYKEDVPYEEALRPRLLQKLVLLEISLVNAERKAITQLLSEEEDEWLTTKAIRQLANTEALYNIETELEHEYDWPIKREGRAGPPYKNCQACLDIKPRYQFPSKKVTPTCRHNPECCSQCLGDAIITEFKSKQWQRLHCPQCEMPLPADVIRDNISPEEFQSYQEYMATYRIMHLKDFAWCRHPGCESGQIHLRGSNDGDNKMVCHKCGNLTCVDCDTLYFPLHRTKDCATITAGLKKKEEAEDQGTAEIIAETSNICPTCGASIQKISGCDFMECGACPGTFTWKRITSEEREDTQMNDPEDAEVEQSEQESTEWGGDGAWVGNSD